MTPWIDIAGWTLVHFVWQGTAIGVVAAVVLGSMRSTSPQARYAVACAALAAMLAAGFVTVILLSAPPAPVERADMTTAAPAALADSKAIASRPLAPVAAPHASDGSNSGFMGSNLEAWLPAVVLCWLAGVVVLLMRLAGGWCRVRRMHGASLAAEPSRWTETANRIASLLLLRRLVRVVDSPLVDTPTVIGWLRPVIVLPIAALAHLTPAQIDAILAHEIAHVRRHDFVANLLQTLAETFLFYHPAVWWVSARIRAEREHCCDQVAVSVCGDAVSYAEALTELETWRTAGTTLAIAATGGSLIERIRRVLGAPADDAPRSFAAMSLAAVAASLLIMVGATHYLRAEQQGTGLEAAADLWPGAPVDTVAWRMVFDHRSSELNLIGYTGRDLIRYAHQIPVARIVGGPAWIDNETFRIVVKVDAPPEAEAMPSIIRRVLEERFQLRTHVETRDFPVHALVMTRVDKMPGPNLRVSTADCFDLQTWIDAGQPPRPLDPTAQRQPVCGEESWDSTISRTSYIAITMPQLAASLRGFSRTALAAADGDWPHVRDIVDRTGLPGRFDVDIHAFLPAAALMGRYPIFKALLQPLGLPSMDRALEQQLGLELEEATAPYDVIVIDSAQRPTG